MTTTQDAQRDLAREYATALYGYLAEPCEEALSVVYELGKRAMQRGFGVLDMATLHRGAISTILTPSTEKLEAAEDFFRELLSPFEMMFRGYADANMELRRVNEALLRERETVLAANRELDLFSSAVSHDLRAPLRAMAGFGALLAELETGPLNPEQRDYVARICANASIMTRLVNDLLELSRIARTDVARRRVDLAVLAQEVMTRLQRANPAREVDVRIPDALVVDGDPGLLRVVLENLLGNAWKFTSKHPQAQIELGVVEREARAVYFVRDDGAGFDMAYVKKLFGPFQRLHATSEFEGTGIGLATVQRIIRRHGGRIWAESTPEHGATFYFTLDDLVAA